MAYKHEPVAMTKESGAKSKRLNEIDEVCASSKQSSHLVLVHGRAAKPIDKIERGNFTQEVRNELENMRLRDVYHIQSFTWSHLMRGNSAIVINSPRTGKTMSYLPAICSLVQMLSEDNRVVDGPGPVAIIVADSSIAVERISKMCRRFYRSFEDPFSVAESYGMRAKPKTIAKLLSGCKILIATPSALARLLKEKVELFRLQRIRYLVFDNIDLIHEELKDDLRTIIKKFCVRDVNTGKTSLQIAVTARSWHPLLMGFLKISNNPQLCIGAYLEGAVYGRSEFQMKFAGKNKMLEILDFLEEHPSSSQPTLIICNNDSDVDEAVETLKASTCFYVSVCSSSTALEIDMALHWGSKCLSSGDLSILVCTDCVLPKIKLTNVQNSIHYSLPKSWSQFSYRFSAHFGYYEDFVKKEKAEKPPAVSLILVDKNNNYQLPKLIEFFEKHDCKIPMEARNLSNQIKMQLEEERIENNKLLCNQLLEFGQCWKNSDCTYRHSFSQFDWPGDDIPANGHIKVEILSVVSPTHYCVRLLEHKEDNPDASWKPINRSNAYLEFSSEFSTYFSDPNNHQTHHPYNLNDLCVLKEENTYYRCKILAENISKKKMSSGNACGQVKLLDFGNIISCKFMDLLVLPEQFKKFPYQAVDLRLTGIVPSDFEWEWDTKTTATVWHWVKTYVTENRYVQAGVVLSLMDTIWVDSLVIMEKLETISSHVSYINIKKCLVEENFAIINEEGLQVITEMARNCVGSC